MLKEKSEKIYSYEVDHTGAEYSQLVYGIPTYDVDCQYEYIEYFYDE